MSTCFKVKYHDWYYTILFFVIDIFCFVKHEYDISKSYNITEKDNILQDVRKGKNSLKTVWIADVLYGYIIKTK